MSSIESILGELRRLGKAAAAEIYRRHGVTGETVGLSFADLGKLEKRLRGQHELGLGLWDSGLHDARVLGARLVDPARMSAAHLGAWLRAVDNHILSGALGGVAAKSPAGLACAGRWIDLEGEWPSSTGWAVYAELCAAGQVSEPLGRELLGRIEKGLSSAPNRTRHTMNAALIAIGGYLAELRAEALRVAASVGEVRVDHGATGCKTPDAAGYIEKMVAHQSRARPARRAGASTR